MTRHNRRLSIRYYMGQRKEIHVERKRKPSTATSLLKRMKLWLYLLPIAMHKKKVKIRSQ